MIITGVASKLSERINRLVYVDAFLPTKSDQAANDMANPERAAEMRAAAAATPGNAIPPHGFGRWSANSDTLAMLRQRCKPHPKARFGKGVTFHDYPFTVPQKTFVRAARYNPSPFQQFYDRYKTEPNWDTQPRQLAQHHDGTPRSAGGYPHGLGFNVLCIAKAALQKACQRSPQIQPRPKTRSTHLAARFLSRPRSILSFW